MHILLGLLGFIVTVLVLLNRLQEGGIDIGWLNPFSWRRRRRYRIQHDINPAFKLDSPMDVAALYMVAVAKIEGDMTKEQKHKILSLFETEFHLSAKEAKNLLNSSAHLLGQTEEVYIKPEKVIERCKDKITSEQSESICYLVEQTSIAEGEASVEQQKLIADIKKACPTFKKGTW